MQNALLSIVIPAYNEEENIPKIAQAIRSVLEEAAIRYEVVFVSDGSKDGTFSQILRLAKEDSTIRGIEFSRNFGKEAAIFAGLERAKGGCTVVMDCDLQHPPQTVVEMYRLWEQGYEIVEGIKNSRGKESTWHKGVSNLFYRFLSSLTGFDLKNTSDFKLLSADVVEVLKKMPERKTFFRALSFWVGFKTCRVGYDVAERVSGKSKWSVSELVRYGISNIIAFSTAPMHILNYVGGISVIIGGALGIQTLIRWASKRALEGFTTVILLLLLLGGGNLLGLGLLGNYIAAIYNEVKQRPRYLVRLETDKILEKKDG